MAIKVNGVTAIDNSRNFFGNGSNLTGVGGITEVVTSGTASGATYIVFSGLSFATYNYKLLLSDMRPSQTAYLFMNFSPDNFASECNVQYNTSGSGITVSNTYAIGRDFRFHTGDQRNSASATYSGVNCELNFMDNKSPSYNYVSIWGHGVMGASTAAYSYETRGGLSYNGATNPVTHMRIGNSGEGLGRTISGRYTLYRSVRA